MRDAFLLALSGALGTLSRYAVSGWAYRWLGERLPYGTLAVNVIGCLLIGFLMELSLLSDLVPRSARLAVTVGFLGAFTTFSTFSYETVRYLEDGAWAPAALNVSFHLVLGILATALGLAAGRALFGGS